MHSHLSCSGQFEITDAKFHAMEPIELDLGEFGCVRLQSGNPFLFIQYL